MRAHTIIESIYISRINRVNNHLWYELKIVVLKYQTFSAFININIFKLSDKPVFS
jgi:hypothetical protein